MIFLNKKAKTMNGFNNVITTSNGYFQITSKVDSMMIVSHLVT